MKQQSFINSYVNTADLHADRLEKALVVTSKLSPITPNKLSNLEANDLAFLDMLTTRFSKLQDIIGGKIFPMLLTLLAEDATAFIDKLNRLEKLGYIDSAAWWMELREIRNQITHDYPDDYELIATHMVTLIPKVKELLDYWQQLKQKIKVLAS